MHDQSDEREQIDDRRDLERGEILPATGGRHGDAAAQQRAAEDRPHIRDRAQQDRDIAAAQRLLAVLRHRYGKGLVSLGVQPEPDNLARFHTDHKGNAWTAAEL